LQEDGIGGLRLRQREFPCDGAGARERIDRLMGSSKRCLASPAIMPAILRRTAMINMVLAGATAPQVASVSGHSIDAPADSRNLPPPQPGADRGRDHQAYRLSAAGISGQVFLPPIAAHYDACDRMPGRGCAIASAPYLLQCNKMGSGHVRKLRSGR
jgi:hypothetical protein